MQFYVSHMVFLALFILFYGIFLAYTAHFLLDAQRTVAEISDIVEKANARLRVVALSVYDPGSNNYACYVGVRNIGTIPVRVHRILQVTYLGPYTLAVIDRTIEPGETYVATISGACDGVVVVDSTPYAGYAPVIPLTIIGSGTITFGKFWPIHSTATLSLSTPLNFTKTLEVTAMGYVYGFVVATINQTPYAIYTRIGPFNPVSIAAASYYGNCPVHYDPATGVLTVECYNSDGPLTSDITLTVEDMNNITMSGYVSSDNTANMSILACIGVFWRIIPNYLTYMEFSGDYIINNTNTGEHVHLTPSNPVYSVVSETDNGYAGYFEYLFFMPGYGTLDDVMMIASNVINGQSVIVNPGYAHSGAILAGIGKCVYLRGETTGLTINDDGSFTAEAGDASVSGILSIPLISYDSISGGGYNEALVGLSITYYVDPKVLAMSLLETA